MNERIRELAKQAGAFVSLSDEHDGNLILSGDDVIDYFAELIINECLFFMAQGDVDFAKWQIKKEFGVEV